MPDQHAYDRAFYLDQAAGSARSASVIVPLLREFVPIHSVCDVGCGVGTWLRCWLDHGVTDVLGIDGDHVARDQLLIPADKFLAADLRQPLQRGRRFDLAMSLEVAEHLPPERAESFVADLTALAPAVLFSAAIPGQGGTEHINERWQSYWASLFANVGFIALDVLRPRIWHDASIEYWYRQNILLFSRSGTFESAASTLPLDVVHPKQLAAVCERTPSIREALNILGQALKRRLSARSAPPR
jgi:SAM-dependent methyltransferase